MLLLPSVTTDPLPGAWPDNVTVPVEFVPPLTLVGFRTRLESVGALTVSVADAAPPFARILAEVLADTGLVVTVNVAVFAPAATVTLAGTCATLVRLELRVTVKPPAPATPFRVTVPVELVPPITDAGLTLTCDTCKGSRVNVAAALPL